MGDSSDSSDDGRSQSRFEKLTRHNWAPWRTCFKNIVTAKGYKNLMNVTWFTANKNTPKSRKMLAWAMNKLYAAVSRDLHPIIASNTDIYAAFKALSTACGEKSVLTLWNKLFNLINLSYNPKTLMAAHLFEFRWHYTSLTSTIANNPDFMTMSMGLEAALLLWSSNHDESMIPLIQSLYDLNPLTFEKVYDWLLIKDSRQASKQNETLFHTN